MTTPEPSWTREPEGDATLEENWLLRLRRERARSRVSGASRDFYVIHLADAVNVIALTPDRRIVLVDQYRAGSRLDSLEAPGGLLEPGEDPLEAGARELLEETGYAGDPPILLGTVWSCPSLLTSRISTIVVANARRVADPRPDSGEEVRLEVVPAVEVPRLIRNGRIGHALSVQGLLWWLASELPGSPFAADPAEPPPRPQFRIAAGMLVIAGIGVLLSPARSVEWSRLNVLPLLFVSFPLIYLLLAGVVFPPPRAILTRDAPQAPRRTLLLFAALGLQGVLAILLLIVSL